MALRMKATAADAVKSSDLEGYLLDSESDLSIPEFEGSFSWWRTDVLS